MRIKKIEIIGFKSFCDRTIVNFGDSVTAIVGPNGCGKSNIVDAIRWCMGEQSAKHLRGKGMEDVIFAGSETRGPAGMAEVSLTFSDVGFGSPDVDVVPEPAPAGAPGEASGDIAPLSSAATDLGDQPVPVSDASLDAEKLQGDGDAQAMSADSVGNDVTQSDASAQSEVEAGSDVDQVSAVADTTPEARDGQVAAQEPSSVLASLEENNAPIDFTAFTEVTITRRLFRDGGSAYLINKIPCRLRDVTDFFMGTGVGTKAYSIIEQGRIGVIVSSRPQDRRSLIEEAAGITRFKSKKRAAERKLDKTRQNLLRVSDIVEELSKRMGSLRRQAQKAERYRRYKGEMRDIDLWKASHRFLELEAEETVQRAQLSLRSDAVDGLQQAIEVTETEVAAERNQLTEEDKRLSVIQEDLYECENSIKISENKVSYQLREATELESRVSESRGEAKSLHERRGSSASRLEDQRASLRELQDQSVSELAVVGEKEDVVKAAREELENYRHAVEEARKLLAQARTELARVESRRESLRERKTETEARLARSRQLVEDLSARDRKLSGEAKGTESQLGELRQLRLDLGNQAKEVAKQLEDNQQKFDEQEAQVETLRTELHRRKSRLQSLNEIQRRYEGFANGTRAAMQNSTLWGASEVHGVVADVVHAPEQFEHAVESALGDRLGGVLVKHQVVGLKGVEYLKSNDAGRSSFVAFANPQVQAGPFTVEDRTRDIQHPPPPPATDGVIGPMCEFVRFDPGFDSMGGQLLGDCILVEDLQTGISLRDQGHPHRFVTLDGDVVDDRGVVSGGSRSQQDSGILAQKREIRQLEEITESLGDELRESSSQLVVLKSEIMRLTRAAEALKTQSHERDIGITVAEKDLGRSREELARVRAELAQSASDVAECEVTVDETEKAQQKLLEDERSATERKLVSEQTESESAGRLSKLQFELDARTTELTNAKVRSAQFQEQRAAAEESVRQLEEADNEIGQRITKIETSVEDDAARASRLRDESRELEESMSGLKARFSENSESLETGRAAYKERIAAVQQSEHRVREMRLELSEHASELNAIELKLSNFGMTRRVLEDGIEERYQVKLAKSLGDYHMRPQIGSEEEKRLAELKRLVGRMGTDINLTAIEEFAEVSERHDFLAQQREDLVEAVDQLTKAINKINRTSRRLFRETFDAINANFQEVFPRLFNGGRAKLALSQPDGTDILEAGVEITAQPPGKKNTTVDQLSGGEKALTAVALIFAIFLIKPSPFCLLDEVDAPLDDSNVDRYNNIIRQMTDRSQFIVITHNKRTMEIADHLYGVTMQEAGISKLVSVNLSKIEASAA